MGGGLSDQRLLQPRAEPGRASRRGRRARVLGNAFPARAPSSATHSGSRRPEASGSRTRRSTSPARTRRGISSAAAASRGGGAARAHHRRRAARARDRELRERGARRGGRRRGRPASTARLRARRTRTRVVLAPARGARSARHRLPPGRPSGRSGLSPAARALEEGAVPFTCQGNLNGLAVEGGETLGLGDRVHRHGRRPTRGAGGRGSARERVRPGADARRVAARSHRPHSAPRHRADRGRMAVEARVRRHRAARKCDQCAPLRGDAPLRSSCGRGSRRRRASRTGSSTTRRTTGSPSSRGCSRRAAGRRSCPRSSSRARTHSRSETTGIDVDPTGSAGLAGLLALREAAEIADDERIAVLFTGVVQSGSNGKETTR